MLVNSGVNWLGFPFVLPVHHEDLSRSEAAEIIRMLRTPRSEVFFVLITYLNSANEAIALAKELGVDCIQFHGDIGTAELHRLKQSAPEIYVIKSLVVAQNNLDQLKQQRNAYSPTVDAFITDTHDPVTGADGATGKTHDWSISAELVRLSPKPVILAGGLTPANVRDAILRVQPFGVDAHTGVEDSRGRKDPELVKAFVQNAQATFLKV